MREPSTANEVGLGERAGGLMLGAAIGIVVALYGISVPLAAIACERIMRAMDAVMAPLTLAVTSVHPILYLLLSAAIVGLLLGKERVLQARAAIVVDISIAVLATLIGVGMLMAVIMPLIMIGKSISGE